MLRQGLFSKLWLILFMAMALFVSMAQIAPALAEGNTGPQAKHPWPKWNENDWAEWQDSTVLVRFIADAPAMDAVTALSDCEAAFGLPIDAIEV